MTMNNEQNNHCPCTELEEGCAETNITRPSTGFINVQDAQIKGMECVADGWKKILEGLSISYGLDIKDENFTDTPNRIAKMMVLETCAGINSKQVCIDILNKNFPAMGARESDQLIITNNWHEVYGICPHHFAPVHYKVWAGYVPKNNFCGISKFARVISLFAKQPILQESFVSGLCDIFMEGLEPKGVICIVSGQHGCMINRGAMVSPNNTMVTSAMRGCFLEPNIGHHWKNEFMSLCKGLNI